MRLDIKITTDDIKYAESILLKEGCFDQQRIEFITNFDTLDLQAVPGSGKTTALLAKLLILERYLPLSRGEGILVISHTNVAIEEITERIQRHCPKLFNYPNFVGTIQRFTDEFLAFPFYADKYKKKPVRIDNEIYCDAVERLLKKNLKGNKSADERNAKYFLLGNKNAATFRLRCIDGKFKLYSSINGSELNISKPKRGKNYEDFNNNEKRAIRLWLLDFKTNIMEQGILHFDDAYFLAETYIHKFPQVKEILQNRFRMVFVDEMQDMDAHQYFLLENLFFCNGASSSSYQRIGDKNQAIFSGTVKAEEVWHDRNLVLPITGSPRLGSAVANIVNNFAIYPGFEIQGLGNSSIRPCMFVYKEANILSVIPAFINQIKTYMREGTFPTTPQHPIKIVAWNTVWQEEQQTAGRYRLTDYFSSYNKADAKPSVDHQCLYSYLINFDNKEHKLASIRKSILNGILMVLRIEDIKTDSEMKYSKKTMIEAIKQLQTAENLCYDSFQLHLYNWCMNIVQGRVLQVWSEIKSYLPEFLNLFHAKITLSTKFINDQVVDNGSNENMTEPNTVNSDGIRINLATVHSVKGQTHSATLYLESAYQGKHESERLFSQFLGQQFNSTKVRDKESSKMLYVGLSRPTHFLAIAIHEDHYQEKLTQLANNDNWTIVKV